jgi:hypothetical protein
MVLVLMASSLEASMVNHHRVARFRDPEHADLA